MNKIPLYIVSMVALWGLFLTGCAQVPMVETPQFTANNASTPLYIIGPGDKVQVFVWGNADLSASVPVRPDGRITTPLVEDVQASGKTPTQLAREMEQYLARYVKNPVVTVYVTNFVGRYSEQIRVIGEAANPTAIPFSENMSLLDVLIVVGGLTEFANGDGASIVRNMDDGSKQQFPVLLDSLIKNGNIAANVNMMPGDILIIPEAWF